MVLTFHLYRTAPSRLWLSRSISSTKQLKATKKAHHWKRRRRLNIFRPVRFADVWTLLLANSSHRSTFSDACFAIYLGFGMKQITIKLFLIVHNDKALKRGTLLNPFRLLKPFSHRIKVLTPQRLQKLRVEWKWNVGFSDSLDSPCQAWETLYQL